MYICMSVYAHVCNTHYVCIYMYAYNKYRL